MVACTATSSESIVPLNPSEVKYPGNPKKHKISNRGLKQVSKDHQVGKFVDDANAGAVL